MDRFVFFIHEVNARVGKSFGWCILVLTLGICYEVFVRYVLRDPTAWAFDFSYIMYGSLSSSSSLPLSLLTDSQPGAPGVKAGGPIQRSTTHYAHLPLAGFLSRRRDWTLPDHLPLHRGG